MKIQEPLLHVGIMAERCVQFKLMGQYRCVQTLEQFEDIDLTCSVSNSMVNFAGNVFETLNFEPLDASNCSFTLCDVTIGIDFHWERKETQQFRGALKLVVENEKVRAINILPTEDYLESVISSEMSATSSLELLKAHAVISRSWVLKPILHPEGNVSEGVLLDVSNSDTLIKWYERDAHTHFHVCADDHCQRYQGITRAGTEAVRLALRETRGELLISNEKICDARFSKSCGGVSEEFSNCWANTDFPYLQAISDKTENILQIDLTMEQHADKWMRTQPAAFCNTHDKQILQQVLNDYDQETNDFYRWKIRYSQAELSELIRKRSGIDFGEILELIPVQRGKSGRIVRLKIIGTKRSITVGKELEIRKWLSESHLYSSAFVVDKDDQHNFTLTGAGWGHGVGLCQIGAAVMSANGYDYKQILQHYFCGAEVQKCY